MAWVILGNGNGMGWERRLETLLLTPTYPPFSQTLHMSLLVHLGSFVSLLVLSCLLTLFCFFRELLRILSGFFFSF
jgi:hypothetical protein